MAEITRAPLACCDCCGAQEEKRKLSSGSGWAKPIGWGHVKVAPTRHDNYPNNIDLNDLCPECNRAIWTAVSDAIDARRKAGMIGKD